MKIIFALITIALFQACETIPIEGRACYIGKDGQSVCVGTDGRVIKIDGTFRSQK